MPLFQPSLQIPRTAPVPHPYRAVQIPFEEMYDLPHFIASMAGVGVRLLRPAEAPPANTVLRLAGLARGQQGGVSEALATTYASIR